jgi:hypothetical protein
MSMIRCDLCENLIDSDDDPECFVEGNPSGCFCKSCRDQAEEAERKSRPMPANIDALIAEHIASDPTYSCDKCDWDVDGCTPCPEHADL